MPVSIKNIRSKIHDRIILYRYIYPFVNKNEHRKISPQNNICLFCQPRGGSTWLAEILLNIPGSILIDEPLWRGGINAPFKKPDYFTRKVPQVADLDFYYYQYIPESADWPEAREVFKQILSGRTVSIGLYEEQGLKRLKNDGPFITKFCYANLLMQWLVNQFEFNSILLTRHPCAVVASQLNYPLWQELSFEKSMVVDDFPFNQFYHSALNKVGKIDSREKFLALIWALGFKNTAMHRENNERWLTVSYEGLVRDHLKELERIDHRFQLGLGDLSIDHKKPSKSTKLHSLRYLGNNEQITSWKNQLTKKQIAVILEVIEKFEIDIYTEDPEPDYNRLYSNILQT